MRHPLKGATLNFTMLFLYILIVVGTAAVIYLVIDFRGPRKIALHPTTAFQKSAFRARELVVQEMDSEGGIWASRGLLLYRKSRDEDKFVRIAHVPTGLSYFWLNNFTLFRKFTNKPECLEATVTGQGTICALSAGYLWLRSLEGGAFQRSMKLPNYGLGVGRGILTYGFKSLGDHEIYWGEYFRNTARGPVKIYKSGDQGKSWEVVMEFEAGFTRHVHSIQQDPYTDRLWVCMGDLDHESRIGWTDDGFKTIHYIGSGSQMWRSAHVVFTEDAVYWGTDSGLDDSAGIYRWDRSSEEYHRVHQSPGAVLFGTRLEHGSLVFSTDREGFPIEQDHLTRIYVLGKGGEVSEMEAGTWKHWKKGFRYSFAMLRFLRNQGSSSLAVTVINQKEFPAGELLMFDEEVLSGTD
jgi:hypothetical protein